MIKITVALFGILYFLLMGSISLGVFMFGTFIEPGMPRVIVLIFSMFLLFIAYQYTKFTEGTSLARFLKRLPVYKYMKILVMCTAGGMVFGVMFYFWNVSRLNMIIGFASVFVLLFFVAWRIYSYRELIPKNSSVV
ncbi:MAG: hypothetical protein WCW78_02665 [Candidatus Paceibacterota bacterium]|jgi:hypothetical protein